MKTSEDGYGIFETLIAMAAILLVSAACITAIFSVSKGLASAEKKNRQSLLLLKTDTTIRRWAENVHIPYWDPPQKTVEELVRTFVDTTTDYSIIDTKIEYSGNMPSGITVTYKLPDDSTPHSTTAAFPCRGVIRDR